MTQVRGTWTLPLLLLATWLLIVAWTAYALARLGAESQPAALGVPAIVETTSAWRHTPG